MRPRDSRRCGRRLGALPRGPHIAGRRYVNNDPGSGRATGAWEPGGLRARHVGGLGRVQRRALARHRGDCAAVPLRDHPHARRSATGAVDLDELLDAGASFRIASQSTLARRPRHPRGGRGDRPHRADHPLPRPARAPLLARALPPPVPQLRRPRRWSTSSRPCWRTARRRTRRAWAASPASPSAPRAGRATRASPRSSPARRRTAGT